MTVSAAIAAEDPHAHHQVPAAPAAPAAPDPHAGHVMPAIPPQPRGLEPAAPTAFAADRIFDPGAMAAARELLRHEHGGETISKVMVDQLEYFTGHGADGYAWDAEAWFGGDIQRLVLKTEGEGERDLHTAEVQALYSHAIGPYFDLQAGVRHDITPNPSRTYAVLGVEGLAPYWFEVHAHVFLSDKGDLFGRLGASYDQLVTQRLVIQPRAELNVAAQDAPGVAGGLTDLEVGVRLRYEIQREFAPYVGISYERKIAGTADLARAAGENVDGTRFVFGIRTWF
jgi:copper resistance protein B